MNGAEQTGRAVLLSATVILLSVGVLLLVVWRQWVAMESRSRRARPPVPPPPPAGPRGLPGPVGHLHTFVPVEGSRVSVCVCGQSIWASR